MCMRKFNQSEEFVDGIFGILNDDKHFINYAAPQKYFHLHTTKNSHLFTRKSQPTKKNLNFTLSLMMMEKVVTANTYWNSLVWWEEEKVKKHVENKLENCNYRKCHKHFPRNSCWQEGLMEVCSFRLCFMDCRVKIKLI